MSRGESWGLEMLPLGQGHKAGGRASVSAQVLLTSHFLSREQYKMLLGSKCQMSRTDSCSAGEEGGAKGCWRPSQPRALSWAGMGGSCSVPHGAQKSRTTTAGLSSHAQLDWRHLWGSALPDLGDKQLSATSLLPGPGYRCSGAAGSCSSSIVWVPGGGERPLVLQTLVRLDLVCAWAVPVSLP